MTQLQLTDKPKMYFDLILLYFEVYFYTVLCIKQEVTNVNFFLDDIVEMR